MRGSLGSLFSSDYFIFIEFGHYLHEKPMLHFGWEYYKTKEYRIS